MIASWIQNLIRRAVLSLVLPQINGFYQAQFTAMGKTFNAELLTPYGFYSMPPIGALSITFAIQGNEDNLVAIAYDPSTSVTGLMPGEVAVGNPITKSMIKFSLDNSVNVSAPLTNLGMGGARIARLGDEVTVMIDSVPYTGTITSAGVNTSI